MALGPLIRRFLGPRLARRAGEYYRAIYVDLAKVAAALAAVIPRDAHVLDVGGGDGQPINHLLSVRPDLTITTLDPAPTVGQWIDARYDDQVKRLPRTSLAEFVTGPHANADVILIADVMHHIPKYARNKFLDSVSVLLDRAPSPLIIVKDVEPGNWRALLGLWSDRYLTGDRDVNLISRDSVRRLFEEELGPLNCKETDLFKIDGPNYAIVFRR
jgi:hypothetical protein